MTPNGAGDDDRWAGMNVQEAAPRAGNPYDLAANPQEHAAWEAAEKAAQDETRRLQEEQRVNEEAERQLVRLRGRHRAEDRFAREQAEEAKQRIVENNRVHDGASFLLDLPPIPPALWGDGSDILWARGESLMICGPQGVGKTTIAGQLLRAQLGLLTEVLGFRVMECNKRVGYLAMDRPEQARRNLGRMFDEKERDYLEEFVRFWSGPPPTDVAVDPETLVRIGTQMDVDVMFVDSIKDAAVGLSKDEVGAAYNRARQMCLAEGIQLVELHHMVKNGADGRAPKALKDVFGSTWITSGAGSVIVLWGDAGDPIVDFLHLKQPMNEVGPFKVLHDRDSGLSSVFHDEDTDVIALAQRAGRAGISAAEAAACLYSQDKPTRAQVQKARRKLGEYVDRGLLVVRSAGGPDSGRGAADRWLPAVPGTWVGSGERDWYR